MKDMDNVVMFLGIFSDFQTYGGRIPTEYDTTNNFSYLVAFRFADVPALAESRYFG